MDTVTVSFNTTLRQRPKCASDQNVSVTTDRNVSAEEKQITT